MLFLQLPGLDPEKIADADSAVKANLEERLETLAHMPARDVFRVLAMDFLEVMLKVLIALAVYFVGKWLIKKLKKFLSGIFERRNVDTSLRTFLLSLISIVLTILLIIIIIDILGLSTTSFIALFASAGLALGVALSGTLQNFAGGVMLLLLKPYRVGDYIEALDQAGTVQSIQLFNTVITTPDNKTIIIPNGGLSTGIINNYSREATRLVEWNFSINYGDDFDKARKVIKSILDTDDRILKERGYTIEINQLGESSVKVVARVWTKAADYWTVYYNIIALIYKTLPAEGILFPTPQMSITMVDSE